MKPNRFFSFLSLSALVCLVFVLASFGQGTDNKTTAGNSGNGEKPSQAQNSAAPAKDSFVNVNDQRYRIGYQDTIEIIVFNHSKLSGNYPVNPDGTIFLPRLDAPIVAACKTELELKNEITEAYKKDYLKNPFVSVRVVDQKSQAFGVMGAVQKPGYYYVNRQIHLLELLTMASGPDVDLAGTQLVVARTGSSSFCQEKSVANTDNNPQMELLHFKLKDVQMAKAVLWMKPGDVVSVLPADPFYVMGNVNKPGMFFLKSPTTLTQAIATAEGFKPASKKDYIRILRQKEGNSEREELIFKYKDIEDKKIQDPPLQANDIVAVSEDKVKSILNSLGKAVTGSLPNAVYRFP